MGSGVCEQCGAAFAPRREHDRFCSARCRVAWNRERTGDPVAGASALEWSVIAVGDARRRLAVLSGSDRTSAFVAVSEAVWAVTIVDAAMVRYHRDAYDGVLADETPMDRRLIEESLAGLRFVRNGISDEAAVADFVEPGAAGEYGVMGWTWRSVARPALTRGSPGARAWEMARYRAYQARLAGRTVGEVFERVEAAGRLPQRERRPGPRADRRHRAAGRPHACRVGHVSYAHLSERPTLYVLPAA
jgi:hypothetical protein